MKIMRIGLVDTSFSHHPENTVPGNSIEGIEWNRSEPLVEEIVCFTNEQIISERRKLIPKSRRIAILYESRDTMSWLYKECENVIQDYQYFFTHEESFLRKFDNTRWIPGNGIWIGNRYGLGERGICSKDRMTSFVTSSKTTTGAQRFRVKLAQELQDSTSANVDVYLRKNYSFDYIPISNCLMRYRFSIVIENTLSPHYFTEKILNCLAVGTIPIYLGATKIGDYFDVKGILQFKNRRELIDEVLPKLDENLYDSRLSAIANNFTKCLSYSSIEKVIAGELLKNTLSRN